MTRKDFELIARTIKGLPTRDVEPEDTRTTVARMFVKALVAHSGNANFDSARFLKACGVS